MKEGILRNLFQTFLTALFFSLLPGGFAAASQDFDEATWRKKVESSRVEDLYAPHFKEGRFFNPWMPVDQKGLPGFLKWKLTGRQDNPSGAYRSLPALTPGVVEHIRAMPAGDFILWVGHATFLMRLNGEFWLTDPMFSDRALLPKRKTPPALRASDLKELGIKKLNVIVSHNHYDHLDKKSIRELPDDARFYIPLGMKRFFTDLGRKDIVEMDWWQHADHGKGVEVVCLPAQHWSRRIDQAIDSTLWASFLIVTPSVKVYFAGDSGYFIGYREIGRRYPGIDYVLMPTTAYRPRWFMHYAHMNIDEAIDAFDDLKARYFVPTQWGAFHLGDDPPGYAAIELKRKIAERKRDASKFIIPDLGRIVPVTGKAR